MTAGKKAKQLGASSLKSVAETYGCTVQNLRHMHINYPVKFEIIVLGVISLAERDDDSRRD